MRVISYAATLLVAALTFALVLYVLLKGALPGNSFPHLPPTWRNVSEFFPIS